MYVSTPVVGSSANRLTEMCTEFQVWIYSCWRGRVHTESLKCRYMWIRLNQYCLLGSCGLDFYTYPRKLSHYPFYIIFVQTRSALRIYFTRFYYCFKTIFLHSFLFSLFSFSLFPPPVPTWFSWKSCCLFFFFYGGHSEIFFLVYFELQ